MTSLFKVRSPINYAISRHLQILLLGAIVVLLAGTSGALAASITNCAGCHGSSGPTDLRPVDAGYRNITSGGFLGSHRTHMDQTATANACAVCHGSSVTSYVNSHRNGNLDISVNINNSPAIGAYSKGTSFPQSNAPVPGTCSNVNCHFEKTTPAWSATPFSYPADCNKCHESPPATIDPGSHSKHDSYYSGVANCVKCHADHTAESNKFAHATSAGNRNLIVQPKSPLNVAGGTYGGAVNDYLPSQSNNYGTCSSTYCHSPGNKASAFDAPVGGAPTWGGGSLPANCTGCHKSDAMSGNPMSSASHTAHVNGFGIGYNTIKCVKCHGATASADMAIVSTTQHVNGVVAVAFNNSTTAVNGTYNTQLATIASPSTKAPGSGYGSCTNVYCHSTGQGNGGTWPPVYQSPTWNSAPTGKCGTCHGIDSSQHSFMGVANTIASGTHTKHLSYRYGVTTSAAVVCAACHAYQSTEFNPDGNPTCSNVCHTTMSQKHVDQKVNVAFPDYFSTSGVYTGTPKPGDGYGGCSNIYCHSSGVSTTQPFTTFSTARWGGAMPANCVGCHGNDATSTPASRIINTNAHGKHMNNEAILGTGQNLGCVSCHSSTVTNNRTISAGGLLTYHVNKAKDYAGSVGGKSVGTYNSGTLVCSNNYCHSSGQATPNYRAVAAWNSGTAYDCKGCHGADSSFAASDGGEPNYANTGVGTANANSHYYHSTGFGITDSAGCNVCHYRTVDSATPGKLRNYSSLHLNGVRDVSMKPIDGKTGDYNSGTKVCSNTYCHGTNPSVAWGNVSIACESCHSVNSGGSGWTSASSHKLHWEDTTNPSAYVAAAGNVGTASAYRFNCSSCHLPGSGKAQHSMGPYNSLAAGQVFFGYTSPGRAPAYNFAGTTAGTDNGFKWTAGGNTSCNATYCHSDGQGHNGSAVVWSTASGSGSCTVCHGSATANGPAGFALSGVHAKHVNNAAVLGSNFKCADCHGHTMTSASNTAIGDKRYHVDKLKNYSSAKAGKSYNASTRVCSNVYCHSSGQAAPNYRTVAAWNSATTYDCKSCHGADGGFVTLAGEPNYANGGVGATANNHQKHVTVGAADCVKCHAKTTANGTAILSGSALHLDKSRDVRLSKISGFTTYSGSYSSAAKTCSATYCHGAAASPAWGNSNLACNACHAAKANDAYWAANSAHEIHWEGTGLPSSYTMTPGNSTGDASTYRFACSSCHDPNSGVHANGPVSANRAAQVFFGFSTAGVKGTYTEAGAAAGNDNGFNWTAGTTGCSSTYCHSNGEGQAGNQAVAWNTNTKSAYNCNFCHGNTRTPNNDWRRGAPLYTSESNSYKGSPKGNAHVYHLNAKAALPADSMSCANCHAATTQNNTTIADKTKHLSKSYNITSVVQGVFSSSFRDGDDTMDETKVTVTYTYSASGSSCSNVSCHPVAADLDQSPPQPKTRATSSVKWNGKYLCVDCHNIAMEDTSTFHHAMRNYSTSYPTLSPSGSSDSGQNVASRRCTMCHVDHNIFSPDLNTSNALGRAANLRTDIGVSPNATTGYTNTDFDNSQASGGICVSCHSTTKLKDTVRRRTDAGANNTPVITKADYAGAAHQYQVSTKFMSDGSVFYGDCSKCHNATLGETSVFMNATSAYQFGNHNSGVRRLQGAMGAAGGETAEEQICYRCHSKTTDSDPGGGPPKEISGKDFYGVATMNPGSEGIFAANKFFRVAGATSSTNKLFFKPTGAESPAENMPNATTNDADLGDTFAGGTYVVQSMSPWNTTTAYATKSQATNQSGTRYWKMVKFVSPAINTAATVPAGTWTINVYARESSTSQNARIRYMVYKWNVGGADAKGTTLIAKGTYATELATTAAPGANRQIGISVPQTTFAANEKIVVDLALETTATGTTSYTGSFYFGANAPSNLTLPGNVTFTYADPGSAGFGHGPQGYFGVHKPSIQDETLAVINQNRHIECNDCHNPHSATSGMSDDYGTATAGAANTLTNTNKSWITNQWAGKTIAIVAGTGSGQNKPITSNTATVVTVGSNWTTNPNNTSVYRIIGNTNLVSNVMRGVPGVSASYTANSNWAAGTFTLGASSTYEYGVCFKCHAKTAAAENTFKYWNVTSASLQAKRWTDVGLEFNPNNQSYHPVVSALPAADPSATYGSSRLAAAQLSNGWTPGMLMSCTDCHDSDSATTGSRGPHGSGVKWMLSGPNRAWPYQGAANNGGSTGTLFTLSNRGTGIGTADGLFCLNCHPNSNQNTGHSRGEHSSYACTECHIRVPHGGKVSRLINAATTTSNLPKRYWPNGNGGGTFRMQRFAKSATPSGYGESSCRASCYGGHSNTTAETW